MDKCKFCNESIEQPKYYKRVFCNKSCSTKYRNSLPSNPFKKRGKEHHNYKGGKSMTPNGYIDVLLPDSQRRHEHILIAEKALGRRLKYGEVVHHINGIKSDNRNTNLLICTNSYHRKLHERMALAYQQTIKT